jgi:hypothetical protein
MAAQGILFVRQMNLKTSMKTIGQKLLFIILPMTIAVSPLRAQPGSEPLPPPAPTNPVTGMANALTSLDGSTATNTNAAPRAKHPMCQVVINQGLHEVGPTLPEWAIITSMTFLLPVCVVALVLDYRRRHNKMLHDTLRLMIEKGAVIPPELLQPPARLNLVRKGNDLRTGLILVGVGLGFLLIKLLDSHANIGSVGFIPLFIGAAFLISWKVGQNSSQPDK